MPGPRPHLAAGLAALLTVLAIAVAVLGGSSTAGPLVLLLAAVAAASQVASTRVAGRTFSSEWDWCSLLAFATDGVLGGLLVVLAACGVEWIGARYPVRRLLLSVAGIAGPLGLAGLLVPDGPDAVATLGAAVVVFGTHVPLATGLIALHDGRRWREVAGDLRVLALPLVLQGAFATALVLAYDASGWPAVALAVVIAAVLRALTRATIEARDRARAHANFSWGVLSGLIRTLDLRDSRAARHCAAVAGFARDIAARDGMGVRDQELAHTAGLLHDIGRFALSDRVMDRGTPLDEEDWQGIRRHPEVGADLLRDVSLYGPVAEVVRAHHERIDGRGYPRGLRGEEIPAISRIVAVAEVYDTLTAPDTYRTPMTSFEALTELRRVAGTQLDAHYVEVLAQVLAGRGTEYRHAGEADYDRELDLERRVNEAALR